VRRRRAKKEEEWDGSIVCGNALMQLTEPPAPAALTEPPPRAVAVRASDPAALVPPPAAALVEDALEAALRVVGDGAQYLDALDAAINYLRGIRDFEAANLGAALAASGHATTTRIVPGKKIGLRAREITVCACHRVSPYDCPSIERITLETQGTGLRLYIDDTGV